jgi:hypothetical protein
MLTFLPLPLKMESFEVVAVYIYIYIYIKHLLAAALEGGILRGGGS